MSVVVQGIGVLLTIFELGGVPLAFVEQMPGPVQVGGARGDAG